MEEPDPRIVAAARSGDLDAFTSLIRRYQPDVARFVGHLARDPTNVEDITQETFVRVYRSLHRYRGDSRFTTWLFSIARNCAVDEARRGSRRRRLEQTLAEQGVPEMSERSTSTGVEVREALASLPLELLEPVVMVDVFGLSYREVAGIVGVAEGTVKSRIHRGREQLVGLLSDETEGTRREI